MWKFVGAVVFPASCWRWLLWIVYVVAWTVALEVPQPIPEQATGSVSPEGLFLFSKTVHVFAYAVLAALTGWLLVARRTRWLLAAFLALHGLGTEYLQYILDVGRTGSWRDVGLDYIGITLGIALTWRRWFGERSVSAVTLAAARDTPPVGVAASPAELPPPAAR